MYAPSLPATCLQPHEQPIAEPASSSSMRSLRPIAITAVFVAALASCWTWSRRATPNEQAMIEAEVANGWTLRNDAVPSTLAEAERSAFALVPDATYLGAGRGRRVVRRRATRRRSGTRALAVGGMDDACAALSQRVRRDVERTRWHRGLGLCLWSSPEASFSAETMPQASCLHSFGQPRSRTISHFQLFSKQGAPRGLREQRSCSSRPATSCLLGAAGASRESTRAPGGTARHVWSWTRASQRS